MSQVHACISVLGRVPQSTQLARFPWIVKGRAVFEPCHPRFESRDFVLTREARKSPRKLCYKPGNDRVVGLNRKHWLLLTPGRLPTRSRLAVAAFYLLACIRADYVPVLGVARADQSILEENSGAVQSEGIVVNLVVA